MHPSHPRSAAKAMSASQEGHPLLVVGDPTPPPPPPPTSTTASGVIPPSMPSTTPPSQQQQKSYSRPVFCYSTKPLHMVINTKVAAAVAAQRSDADYHHALQQQQQTALFPVYGGEGGDPNSRRIGSAPAGRGGVAPPPPPPPPLLRSQQRPTTAGHAAYHTTASPPPHSADLPSDPSSHHYSHYYPHPYGGAPPPSSVQLVDRQVQTGEAGVGDAIGMDSSTSHPFALHTESVDLTATRVFTGVTPTQQQKKAALLPVQSHASLASSKSDGEGADRTAKPSSGGGTANSLVVPAIEICRSTPESSFHELEELLLHGGGVGKSAVPEADPTAVMSDREGSSELPTGMSTPKAMDFFRQAVNMKNPFVTSSPTTTTSPVVIITDTTATTSMSSGGFIGAQRRESGATATYQNSHHNSHSHSANSTDSKNSHSHSSGNVVAATSSSGGSKQQLVVMRAGGGVGGGSGVVIDDVFIGHNSFSTEWENYSVTVTQSGDRPQPTHPQHVSSLHPAPPHPPSAAGGLRVTPPHLQQPPKSVSGVSLEEYANAFLDLLPTKSPPGNAMTPSDMLYRTQSMANRVTPKPVTVHTHVHSDFNSGVTIVDMGEGGSNQIQSDDRVLMSFQMKVTSDVESLVLRNVAATSTVITERPPESPAGPFHGLAIFLDGAPMLLHDSNPTYQHSAAAADEDSLVLLSQQVTDLESVVQASQMACAVVLISRSALMFGKDAQVPSAIGGQLSPTAAGSSLMPRFRKTLQAAKFALSLDSITEFDVSRKDQLDLYFTEHPDHSITLRSALLRNSVPSGVGSPHVLSIRGEQSSDVLTALSRITLQRNRLSTAAGQPNGKRKLTIVHFNDVYNLNPKVSPDMALIGGASRFHTVLQDIRERENPLVLFSGDFMGPSLMSVDMKGKQMIDFLNQCGVHYGCFGNHEFDYGIKALHEVIQGFTFGAFVFTGSTTKWVMSNMFEADGSPVCGASPRELFRWNGISVGIIGLCEDWVAGCSQLSAGEVTYVDMFERGETLAQELKQDGAEIVIALTHCRLANDKELMRRCPSIDLLLGGHDHFYKCVPSLRIVKSGEEFQFLSEISVEIESSNAVHYSTSMSASAQTRTSLFNFSLQNEFASDRPLPVSSSSAPKEPSVGSNNPASLTAPYFPPQQPQPSPLPSSPLLPGNAARLPRVVSTGSVKTNNSGTSGSGPPIQINVVSHPIHNGIPLSAPMEKMIKRYIAKLDERMGGVVGRTPVELDPRETACRFKEGLLTGFVCDVIVQEMRAKMMNADIAIIGGAAFSGKAVIPPGNLTMGDIFDLFPNDTRVMCMRMPGKTLRRMLTVMVRELPEEAPSFPHCSADLSFTISLLGGLPAKVKDIRIRGEPINEEQQYLVAVEDFAGKGNGKYKFLRTEAELLVEEENAAQVVFWLIDYFSNKKGQSQKSGEALEDDAAVAARGMEKNKRRKKDRRKQRYRSNREMDMMQSMIDHRVPRYCFPVRQFKTIDFAATLDSNTLARLYAATSLLTDDVESGANISLIEKVVMKLLKSVACRVYLYDETVDQLRALTSPHGTNHSPISTIPADASSLAGYSVLFRCAIITKKVKTDNYFSALMDSSPNLKVTSMLTVPILFRKKCLGVVQALNKEQVSNGSSHRERDEWQEHTQDDEDSSSDEHSSEMDSEESSQLSETAPHSATRNRRNSKAARREPRTFTDEDQGLALLLSKQIGLQMHFSTIFSRMQRSEVATRNLLEMARLLGKAQKDDSVQAMVLRITEVGKHLIGCDRCSLFLVDQGQMWTVVKSKDLTTNVTIRLPLGTGVAGQSALHGKMMNVHDAYQSEHFNPDFDLKTGYHTKTILAVPMLSESREIILGVLQLINKKDGTVFTAQDEELAQNFVDLAAIAVHNSFEIETLRLGRDESTLQVLPVHELDRITFKGGWHTVRKNLRKIVLDDRKQREQQQQQQQHPLLQSATNHTNPLLLKVGNVSSNPLENTPIGTAAVSAVLGAGGGGGGSSEGGNASRDPTLGLVLSPQNSTSPFVAQAMMDFDDLRSDDD